MGLFSRKASCIGLDIGASRIKLMEIQKTGQEFEVTNYSTIPTPEGLIESNIIISEQGVVSIMQKLIERIQVQSPKVAMAVSGDNVMVRNLTLPVMPDRDLAEAVRFEAEAQIPLHGNEVTVDFIKQDVIKEGNVKNQDILAVVVRNDVIKKLVRIAEAAGLEPVVMDIEPLAIHRAISTLNRSLIPQEGTYAVVNIGSASTNIAVFENERLAFTRTLGFGGHKLSLSLTNHYNMSLEEAEGTKRLIDFSGESDQQGLSVLLYQKMEVLLPVVTELITEVGRSLEYYLAQHRNQKVSKIFITGGGAQMKGLAAHMSEELDMPVTVFNPTKFLKLSGKVRHYDKEFEDGGSALALVAGLALSEV